MKYKTLSQVHTEAMNDQEYSAAFEAGRSAGQSGRRRVLYRDAEYHPAGSGGGGGAIAPAYPGTGSLFA